MRYSLGLPGLLAAAYLVGCGSGASPGRNTSVTPSLLSRSLRSLSKTAGYRVVGTERTTAGRPGHAPASTQVAWFRADVSTGRAIRISGLVRFNGWSNSCGSHFCKPHSLLGLGGVSATKHRGELRFTEIEVGKRGAIRIGRQGWRCGLDSPVLPAATPVDLVGLVDLRRLYRHPHNSRLSYPKAGRIGAARVWRISQRGTLALGSALIRSQTSILVSRQTHHMKRYNLKNPSTAGHSQTILAKRETFSHYGEHVHIRMSLSCKPLF